jgi:ATP-dependent RNA helicase DeaD
MEAFRKLGIIEPILKALKDMRFSEPTAIQEQAIPHILAGKDVIGGSATGSGKTLAFGAGIIQNSEKGKGIQALVLTPTRELAEQVTKELYKFSKNKSLKIVVVYGGVSINPQMDALKTADVVVGTPGRILDHLERRTINFSKVNTLVLDEADLMLDMGFVEDVEMIISQCPKNRQTMLFSATIHSNIAHLIQKHMRNPEKVDVTSYVDASKLHQIYYDVPANMKFSLLVHLLKKEQEGLVMVFCNTRHYVDFVEKNLKAAGIEATAIHGGLTQSSRNQIMDRFHAQKVYVLVCTDVAARGLDIKGVSHVYNYDIPKDSKQYVHRIGRTARAGEEGKAVNLLAPMDHENFYKVQRDKELHIIKEPVPQMERVAFSRPEGRSGDRGGRFGGRSGGSSFGGGDRHQGGQGGRRFSGPRPQGGGYRSYDGAGRGEARSSFDGGERRSRFDTGGSETKSRFDGGSSEGGSRHEGGEGRPQHSGGSHTGGFHSGGPRKFHRRGAPSPRQ